MTEVHDVIIVGAGIAGLHCARRLLEEKPHLNVLMLEKYNYIGGRVVTFRPKEFPEVHWENGAGRIHVNHTMVMKYIRKYGLTFIPISDDTWIQYEDNGPLVRSRFLDNFIHYVTPLHCLPDNILESHTIENLLKKTIGIRKTKELLAEFPYRAEVNTLRADEGINRMLATDDVMGAEFGVCAEGLDRLIEGLVNEVVDSGATILLGHSVEHITKSHGLISIESYFQGKPKTFVAKKVILALHSNAMKHIPEVAKWPLLKQLAMRPLLRVYAIFPGEPWFDKRKIVFTNNPIRYFIPIDPSRGICMLSYTDADDTQTWMKDAMGDPERLQKRMMTAIRRAFPMRRIPDPVYFKTHPWTDGCTYWLPAVRATATPIPEGPHEIFEGVYACGESFSPDKQCWMEGALESAEQLVKHLTAH
jgi:monoamine oxidase